MSLESSAELDRIHEESQGLDTNDIGFREHENGLRGPYTGDGDDHITSVKGVAEANNEEVPESWLQAYRDFIPGTEAYQWLVTRLQREFRLVPTEPNTIGSIGGAIMSSLPSAHKISRRISTQRCSARFELQWDIFHFFQTQEYPGPPDEVLEGIITLTGSSLDAQAATCAQYIHQTWPSTGETTLQLIKEVLKDGDGYLSSCKLSDGTTLSAWVDGSKFIAEASGVAVSVMEIGEQLAWLGAALRTSTRQSGLVYCTPNISILHNNASSTLLRLQLSSADITCEIGFTMEEAPQTPDNANGQCWHDIFRNPVVVRGYPILRRVECSTGLEVPLNIMAGLARTQRVDRFNDKIYIKGFSTMLIPIRRKEDILCWHLIYNKDGNRISYLDSDLAQEQGVARLNLEGLRHVLGWCSKAQVLAGSAKAHYPVACSGLPNPDEDCALAKTWVSAGRMIIGGPKFNLGTKDIPIQISRHGYVPRLQWLATKLVLLWDERDKRGWLINGTSALLHVLRASLKHDNEGALRDLFLCNPEDLQEPDNRFTADSAIEVLVKSKNRGLRLYGEKDGDILLENRIDHLYNILEKLIDHQADIAGYCGEKLEGKPRKYLEGWDFEDLMLSTTSDLHARVATIDTSGKSWVDLTRAVHAVTLVGCGFGNIIRPANADICDHWTELPKQKYYIAGCFSDLNRVVKQHGSLGNPFVRLSQNLIWHTPTTMFEACRCRGASEKDQCEPVQTLFPLALSERLPPRTEAVSEEKHGALIFGTTSHFPWVWGDTGFPQEGEDSKVSDSGIGSSQAISASESESNTRFMMSPSDFHASSGVQNSTAYTSCKRYPRRVYEVGIICALWKELKAVRALFDSEHGNFNKDEGDDNQYVLGTLANHIVVAACLPAGEYGTNSAASVASNMVRSFPALKFCLLVGIAGGAPSEQNDIRLGDVVVGIPEGRSSGVVQYDLGKDKESSIFQVTGSLRGPPRPLTSAINTLRSVPNPPSEPLKQHLENITNLMPEYRRPAQEAMPCTQCRSSEKVCSGHHGRPHTPRPTMIHYGPIGSGNSVIKNATRRDQLAREHGVLCFEMEAAGVVNAVSCLVIRGICDYCDVHKNDDWQNYAAATAAAYSKLLLGVMAGKQGAG
ncbi:hypothetical protein CDV31_009789 [Fusarium ambrosium]|uniref:Nucleoside phosphorylase domain-containing protein n=1 Tax=Fusarium ambrosium TaxID=131363 RepID=A0A428TSG8_9HYPO|nr:hypothetical protein CDV31_009789 [Fusarium ambrosium]